MDDFGTMADSDLDCKDDIVKLELVKNEEDEGRRYVSRVGAEFQAFVPDIPVKPDIDESDYGSFDLLLWSPDVLGYREVEEYLMQVKEITEETNSEEDLYVLMESGYRVSAALKRRKSRLARSLPPAIRTEMVPWTESECRDFEEGMIKHKKDFRKVQSLVKTRSLAQVVEFYYFWKKSARHDLMELQAPKKEKSCLDYMDHFVEEDEDSRASRGRRYLLKNSIRTTLGTNIN